MVSKQAEWQARKIVERCACRSKRLSLDTCESVCLKMETNGERADPAGIDVTYKYYFSAWFRDDSPRELGEIPLAFGWQKARWNPAIMKTMIVSTYPSLTPSIRPIW